MARIEITDTSVLVQITGLDRILALQTTITIPIEHVASIDRNAAEAAVGFHGLKLPGTGIPGVLTAGSFLKSGEWSFWDVHDPTKTVILRLHDEHYSRVVVEVDDPDATVAAVTAALAARGRLVR